MIVGCRLTRSVSGLYSPEMARSKEFDPRAALSAAVQAFWRDGYEKTSAWMTSWPPCASAVRACTTRLATKRELYLSALEAHRGISTQAAMQQLFASGRPLRVLIALLFGIAHESRAQIVMRGDACC